MQFQDRAGVYSMCGLCGGGRRESRFDSNPRYMAARNAGRSIGKIEDCKQPISKQSTETRKYNSIISE